MTDSTSEFLLGLAAGRPIDDVPSLDNALITKADSHGLIPLLSRITDDVTVRAISARLFARQVVMRRNLLRILEALDGRGIRVSVMKGPSLALSVYDEPGLRPFTDVDLLVESHLVGEALEVIAGDAMVRGVPAKRPKADKRDVVVSDPGGVVFNLDLHWDLFSYSQLRGSARGATAEAWSRATRGDDNVLGPRWLLPSEAELCFLATHAVLDHRFRLILFRDLAELSKRGIDWDSLNRFSSRWGLRSTTYVALAMARRFFGAPISDSELARLRPQSEIVAFLDRALDGIDLVEFDGHRVHPVNLAFVLLNDSLRSRVSLAVRAPVAFPGWRRRSAPTSPRSAPTRVLFVASSNRRRGAEVVAERLARGLSQRGFVVDAVSLGSVTESALAALEPLTQKRPSEMGRLDVGALIALWRRVRRRHPDVVVAFGPTLRYCALISIVSRVHLVYVAIGEPAYWLRSRMSAVANKWLMRRADQIIAVASATKSQLIEIEPELEGKVSVGHTGVPEYLFAIPRADHDGPIRILMVGALSKEKDPAVALDVLAGAGSGVLRLVGTGPLRQFLSARASALGLAERVELVGGVDDVAPHFQWADILLLTSRTEGLPAAILEAGAAGVPTVAYSVGGVAEAVRDGVTGILARPGDLGALVAGVQRLDADRGLLSEMASAARRHVRENFRIDRAIDEYARLLTANSLRRSR